MKEIITGYSPYSGIVSYPCVVPHERINRFVVALVYTKNLNDTGSWNDDSWSVFVSNDFMSLQSVVADRFSTVRFLS